MSGRSQQLLPRESTAVSEYVRRLPQALGYEPKGVWLFGSKARGDSDPDSDIDLLVILEDVQPETQWHIWDLSSDISLQYDVLLNTHIIDAARWRDERQYRGTLWREIEHDGVPLKTSPTSTVAT